MTRTVVTALPLSALFSTCLRVQAQSPSVVAHHAQALGGIERVQALHSIVIRGEKDASVFSPAPRPRTPLQQFLEHLYMERTDPIAVMYSYRVFRLAHPELDTRDGVEFIGYQMAKMDDFRGAIALLRANAADYPASASAVRARTGLQRSRRHPGRQARLRAGIKNRP